MHVLIFRCLDFAGSLDPMWRLQTKLVQLFAAVALLIVALSIGKGSLCMQTCSPFAGPEDKKARERAGPRLCMQQELT